MHEHPEQQSNPLRGPQADFPAVDDAQQLEQRLGLVLRELAHEFGNLIFPLQMVMELQERSGKLTPEELNDILRGHIAELTIVTRRFQRIGRCFSDRLAPDITTVRPADVVTAAVEDYRRAIDERRQALVVDLAGSPATMPGDPDLLQFALAELVDNAVRFAPPDGRIDIVVRQQRDKVEFLVCDDGPGIAPELQPLVFLPFVHGGARLDIGAGRFGCGLTLVDRIARAHGGQAELRRSSQAGSEFAITVPATASP